MKMFLSLMITVWASQSAAQDGLIRGSLICDVVASETVATKAANQIAVTKDQGGFSPGMSLTLEYTLAGSGVLSVVFFETDGGRRLIEEPFAADSFRGVSPYSNQAEFRASYSEASLGRFGFNYKGSDQLFIKNGCGNGNWQGHFVQPHLGGHLAQVVSLNCHANRNAVDDLLARLKASL